MSTDKESLNADVAAAQAALDKLLKIEKLLWTELPAAQNALRVAEKRLREANRPDRAASRKHEIDLLKKRLGEAQNV
ncbi:hypothetical protein [Pseudomonas fluorescens]|uniref:Uncharacterized protein n=1 Tax=Pseudomonas fluorescens TaxID=294 RepID=A0A5E7EZC1_PSEFL|nr:hypothetical protein [Pseudomonas fluorescens]VVO32209.1 hypothetical protein PS691_05033 [Pseudomonas fluorescens]